MPSGGRRPGAGRKPRAERFAKPIAAAEQKIADKLPWLIDKAFVAAGGVQISVPVIDETTGKPLTIPLRDPVTDEPMVDPATGLVMTQVVMELVYDKLPDIKAIAYLIDRVMGRIVPDAAKVDTAAVDIRQAVARTEAAARAYVAPSPPPTDSDPDANPSP